MDRLTAMSVFRKVVERSSFTGAADHLRMSNGSVSKYVASLEEHIGTALLARTTRRISLTEAGRIYYEKCVRILDDIEEAETSTVQSQTTPRGLLKVRAPVSLGAAHLGRSVAAFLARFPEVSVELTLNDRFADPADEGVDVALRIAGNLKDPARVARPIARMVRTLCAAPGYLARRGPPASVAHLKRHNCVIYSRGHAPDEWRFTGTRGERMVRVSGNLRSNNALVLREALLHGEGIGLLPMFLVAADVSEGRLHVPLPEWLPELRFLYAVFPQHRHPSPKVRQFVDFLARDFAADSQWQMSSHPALEPFNHPPELAA